jgi:hypothetical protein
MLKNWYRFLSPSFQSLFLEYRADLRPRYGHGEASHPILRRFIEQGRERYAAILADIAAKKEQYWTIKDCRAEKDPLAPCWNNGYLPGLDMLALHYLIGQRRPRIYCEVGSGNSTKVARHSIAAHGLDTVLWAIDPQPRVDIGPIVDRQFNTPLESVDPSLFDALEAGDILFIDNSHRALPNSDVVVFFLDVLPRLKKGVVVQLHDIYLPDDYPPFMCERFYSEQYLLAVALLHGPEKYQIILPCWFVSEDPALHALLAPVWTHAGLSNVERHGGSFWMEIAG